MPQPPQGEASGCDPEGTARPAPAMGLTHCPLCMALAMLCLVRACCHGGLLWQVIAAGEEATAAGAPTWPITPPIA